MTDPVILRVNRPYPDEDAYLAAEAWSIDDKAVLLIDQPSLPRDTVVRFEIVLEDGSKPIRAEGKVHKLVSADGDHPGGLRIRFRRFDAATKAFIDRVMEERRKERRSKRPPSMAPLVLEPEPTTADDAAEPSAEASKPEQSAPEVVSQPVRAAPAVEPARRAPSGRGPRAVEPPANRDELLAKLRSRAKQA